MKTAPSQTPIAYIKERSGITKEEWYALTPEEQDKLKLWAVIEMRTLGIEVRP